MKLRNKKTGEIQNCDMIVISDKQIDTEIANLNRHTFIFRSIEQFIDEYEAYTMGGGKMKKSEESEPLSYYQCIEILNNKISTNVKQICHDEERLKWHDEDIEKLRHLMSVYGSLLIINYIVLVLLLIIMIVKG